MRIHIAALTLVAITSTVATAKPLPRVVAVTFTRLKKPSDVIRVVVRGHNMTGRWRPAGAVVGKTELVRVVAFPGGKGFSGLLTSEPPDGSNIMLKNRQGELFNTGAIFWINAVRGAPREPLAARENCAYPIVPGRSIGRVRLGMSAEDLRRMKATADPQNSVWFHRGPITAKVAPAGKVDLLWINRPTACLVERGKVRKLDLPRPRTPIPAAFPYPDCPWMTATVGGGCFFCAARGLAVCHGTMGWYPTVRVMPPSKK